MRKLIKVLKRYQVPSMLFDYVHSLEIPEKKPKTVEVLPVYIYEGERKTPDPTKFDIEKKLELSRETNEKLNQKIYFLEKEKEDLQKRILEIESFTKTAYPEKYTEDEKSKTIQELKQENDKLKRELKESCLFCMNTSREFDKYLSKWKNEKNSL